MKSSIAIIMCCWKRIDKLPQTFKQLEAQRDQDFVLYLWNNNPDNKVAIQDAIGKTELKVYAYHSENNVGGIGRFYYAKQIVANHEIVVFIDDDQIFNENMTAIFRANYDENAVKSRWAFRFQSTNYWDRFKPVETNQPVHYCGTGGLVIPAKVFKDPKLFDFPVRFLFVEDLWLSYYCDAVLGMKLLSIKDDFMSQIADQHDQYKGLANTKREFLDYLLGEKKWILK